MKKHLFCFSLFLTFTFLLVLPLLLSIDVATAKIDANGMVRLVYLLPNDRPAQPDRVAALRRLIKDAQQFYAEQMGHHGFLGETFSVEMDAVGEPVVHQINGKFNEEYYYTGTSDFKIWAELLEHFSGTDALQHVYFIAIDLSYEALNDGQSGGLGGVIFYPAQGDIGFGPPGKAKLRHRDITTGEEVLGGFALIPAFGHNFDRLGLTLHELGHGFGLVHDFRTGRASDYVMGFGNATHLSKCAAEWLSVSRFFNTKSTFHNEPGEIQLLSLQAYSQGVINLRFEVTDPDGLHQAQLLVPTILENPEWAGWGPYRLFDCKRLSDKTDIVESSVRTTELVDRITLQIIDVGGNITWATFPIDLGELATAQNTLDVNGDGFVNISDLTPLASQFGQRGKDGADVNDDGVVDIMDVLLVASVISSLPRQSVEAFTVADVQKWLTDAKQLETENELLKKGVVRLDHLLAVLTAVEVDLPDPNLRAAIETALNMAAGAQILSSDMETLPRLEVGNANITDLTGLEHATNLTTLYLWENSISDISPLAGLTQLINLSFADNSIVNISAVAGLTNLTALTLGGNSVTDISPLAGLTNLTLLHLPSNPVADISLVAGLVNLTYLNLNGTNISDISPVAGLTHLTDLYLGWNNITDLSPLAGLTDLSLLWLQHNNISDLTSLVTNTGLGSGDEVNVDGNPLSYTSINIHIPTLRSRGVVVHANNLKPTTLEFLWLIPAGTSLIHVPLKVTTVDGVAKTLTSISDLYDALGGVNAVNFLITYEPSTQEWLSYFSPADRGTAADRGLTADMGIVAGMKTAATIQLRGEALGTAGSSAISLNQGVNLVGLPLRNPSISRVSDLLTLDGIRGNVPVIILADGGDFKSVGRAGDPGDIAITGGQGFMLTAQRATTVTLSGEGWTNGSATAAAPQMLIGIEVGNTTPVLVLKGEIVDKGSGVNRSDFRVAVENFSSGRQVAATADEEAGYRLAVVDIETMQAARAGDVLEILAQSFNPFIGVKPLQYTVTAEDVKQGLIQLPALVAYEIPTKTELLANYPNPFNPETWIPYRLAEDALVTLTIYDRGGHAVRTIDVGHRVAAVYESRSKAVYWDGRNTVGEPVASGLYFYTLTVRSSLSRSIGETRLDEFTTTRRMLILK